MLSTITLRPSNIMENGRKFVRGGEDMAEIVMEKKGGRERLKMS